VIHFNGGELSVGFRILAGMINAPLPQQSRPRRRFQGGRTRSERCRKYERSTWIEAALTP